MAIGYSVQMALPAVEKLRSEGAKVGLINARFVKPLDEELIGSVARRSKRIVTVEENARQGGFGSAVLELLAREEILVPLEIVGIPDEFIHHASPKIQRDELGLDASGIEKTVRAQLGKIAPVKAKSNGAKNGSTNGSAKSSKTAVVGAK